jgi:hypothetical protein
VALTSVTDAKLLHVVGAQMMDGLSCREYQRRDGLQFGGS